MFLFRLSVGSVALVLVPESERERERERERETDKEREREREGERAFDSSWAYSWHAPSRSRRWRPH